MAKLVWDQTGDRLYETGISKGVLFVKNGANGAYAKGVAWNGLTAVTESPSGAEPTALYADDIKYLELRSVEEFGATIEAYTYPEEFEVCDGSAMIGTATGGTSTGVTIGQQDRVPFALCYRTVLGNDSQGNSHGYKLHIIYGAVAAPSEKAYETINDSPDALTFSWEITTTPVNVTGFKPTSTLVIDSTKVAAAKLTEIENKLYGTESEEPTLLLPDAIITILNGAA